MGGQVGIVVIFARFRLRSSPKPITNHHIEEFLLFTLPSFMTTFFSLLTFLSSSFSSDFLFRSREDEIISCLFIVESLHYSISVEHILRVLSAWIPLNESIEPRLQSAEKPIRYSLIKGIPRSVSILI